MPLVARRVGRGYVFSHPCDFPDCGEEGSFGYNVKLLAKRGGSWYCRSHAPREVIDDAPKPSSNVAPRIGRLGEGEQVREGGDDPSGDRVSGQDAFGF